MIFPPKTERADNFYKIKSKINEQRCRKKGGVSGVKGTYCVLQIEIIFRHL